MQASAGLKNIRRLPQAYVGRPRLMLNLSRLAQASAGLEDICRLQIYAGRPSDI